MGAFLGGGHRVTPSDAAQQMARVRYLRRFVVALLPNSEVGAQDPDAVLRSWETAARFEGGTVTAASDFDRLVASIRADEQNARADFAAGLLWQLDRAGWNLCHAEGEDSAMQAATKAAQDAREAAHRAALIEARHLDDDEAAEIERRADRTEAEGVLIEAHAIRLALNLDELTTDVLDFWDGGRAVRRMDRFSAAQGIVPEFDASKQSLSRRRFWKACARAYGYLFNGIYIEDGEWLTAEVAERIVGRAIEQRHLLATLGIVPAEFGRWQEDRQGNPLPMRLPAAPIKTVGRILALMGLQVEGRRVRRCSTSHGYTLGNSTPSGTPEASRLVRVYSVTPDSLATMAGAVERRNAARRVVQVPQFKPIAPVVGRVLTQQAVSSGRIGAVVERLGIGRAFRERLRRQGAA
jgi:putative DNA primase/helicase